MLKAKVETLVNDGLKLIHVNINKTVRQVSRIGIWKIHRKPNTLFVEVDTLDNKKVILKAKSVLRNSNKYRDVYIENNILLIKPM